MARTGACVRSELVPIYFYVLSFTSIEEIGVSRVNTNGSTPGSTKKRPRNTLPLPQLVPGQILALSLTLNIFVQFSGK